MEVEVGREEVGALVARVGRVGLLVGRNSIGIGLLIVGRLDERSILSLIFWPILLPTFRIIFDHRS